MHRIKNVHAYGVLNNWSGLLRIRSCRSARNLGDQGTWLPVKLAITRTKSGLLSLVRQIAQRASIFLPFGLDPHISEFA